MSPSLQTAVLFPEWKQEVNRRVAAHLSRKTHAQGETAAPAENRPVRGSRAAQAAARVAARYANAPSYGEMLTREARAAVHAAEAASKAAKEAHAAVQYVLDGLEAVTAAEPAWQPEIPSEHVAERHAAPVTVPLTQMPPQRPHIQPRTGRPCVDREEIIAPSRELDFEAERVEVPLYDVQPRYQAPSITEAPLSEPGEFVQPIYGNLIEFPREMIAKRKARPRRAEGPLATAESAPQLSIFEVDPAAISTTPPPAAVDPPTAAAWLQTSWPGMTLKALPPAMSLGAQPLTMDLETEPPEELLGEPALRPAPEIELAPMSRRLLAVFVDCTLIAGAAIAAAMVAASHVSELPGLRAIEMGAGLVLLAIGAAYHACFMTVARATPGMRYAGIELNTFAGYTTTRAQRWGRLMALPLSVLPLGLGVVWALFEDDHMTWHDRLSRTYLRKR